MVKRGLLLDDQAPAKFVDASGVLYVSLKAPSQVSSGNVFITLPANQPISGTILIANASGELCWCPILKSGDVTSGFIGNASVVSGSIASGQIGSIHLASGTIPAGFALSSGIITSGYIGNAAVTSGNVASGQIGHFHIADNAVQSGNIASGNVGIYKLDALTTTYTANSGLIVGQVLTYTGSGMIWQDSEKEILIVRNDTGVTITKGSVVYISGGLGNKPLVTLASASSESASSKTIGVMQDDLANNEEGRCLVSGILEDVNTNSYAAGDRLYLSITAGQWTTTRYQPPVGHQVYIGTVVRSHINFGRIAITIQNGFEVNELHDVRVMSGSYASGQVLQYTTQSGGYWQNVMYSVGSGYIGNGAILSGNIASGQIDLFHLASGTVFSGTFVTSGSVQSGSLGNASVVSGSIGSGQIGLSHLASGTVFSGTFLLSGNVTSGYIGNSSVNSGNITLGVIGNIHIASGGLTSGAISSGSIGSVHLADGAVQSGDISSGQIGRMHLSSGAVNSGHLAANSVVSGDIASGTITGGSSGQVQVNNGAALTGSSGLTWDGTILSANQLTLTNSVGDEGGEILLAKAQTNTTLSGTGVTIDVYQDRLRFFEQGGNARGFYLQITSGGGGVSTNIMADGAVVLQSGQVQSGFIGNAAVVSGNIASGQVSFNHLSSGAATGNLLSGSVSNNQLANSAITINGASTALGGSYSNAALTIGTGLTGGSYNGSGAVTVALASGAALTNLLSGNIGSGLLANNSVVSGSIASGQIGVNHLISGLITTLSLGSGQVTSGNIASGVVFRLLSGNITSGFIGDAAVVSGNIASGQIFTLHIASGGLLSGAIGSGQIGQFHLASGVGGSSLTSGYVTSGYIGNAAIVSGSVGSGQIGTIHFSSGSVAKFTSSSSAPSSPSEGDRWYYTDDGVLLTYVNDGSSSQWVQF